MHILAQIKTEIAKNKTFLQLACNVPGNVAGLSLLNHGFYLRFVYLYILKSYIQTTTISASFFLSVMSCIIHARFFKKCQSAVSWFHAMMAFGAPDWRAIVLSGYIQLCRQNNLSPCLLSCLPTFTFIPLSDIFTQSDFRCIQYVEVYANVWVHEWFAGLGCHGNMFVEYIYKHNDENRCMSTKYLHIHHNCYSSYLFSTSFALLLVMKGVLCCGS